MQTIHRGKKPIDQMAEAALRAVGELDLGQQYEAGACTVNERPISQVTKLLIP